MSFWIYFNLPESILTHVLIFCIIAMLLRACIQPILMYIIKKWTPYYGMTFNILLAFYVIFQLISTGHIGFDSAFLIHEIYLGILAMALLADTYFAYQFHKIVGQSTKGDKAIWYASAEDVRFRNINRITFFSNIAFFCLTFVLLYQILKL
jgi:hypothetical protein